MSKKISPEKKANWETIFRKQKESGLSVARWCKENQVCRTSFNYWNDRIFTKPELLRSDFVEMPLTEQGSGISIEYQGLRVIIEKSFDPITLRACISALRGVSC